MALYGLAMRPRNLFLYALGGADQELAHDVVGDDEMDARFARIFEKTTPALFCDPARARGVGIEGAGHFAHAALATANADPLDGPVGARRLAELSAPVLLIKPSCDYLPWSVVPATTSLLPQTQVVVLPGTGHQAHIEDPHAHARLVDAFLAGEPLPYPVVTSDVAPDSYQGER